MPSTRCATSTAASTASMILYGIPNCDTVKKARAWLDEHGFAHAFHDYKKQGVPPAEMRRVDRSCTAGRSCSTAGPDLAQARWRSSAR